MVVFDIVFSTVSQTNNLKEMQMGTWGRKEHLRGAKSCVIVVLPLLLFPILDTFMLS